jgi:RNA recognition motif-containing protein
MNIYVANLPFSTTAEDLESAFSAFGTIKEAKIITDFRSRRSKGYGFVDMPDNSEADQAIKALNRSPFDGNIITVRPADSGKKKKKKRRRFRR